MVNVQTPVDGTIDLLSNHRIFRERAGDKQHALHPLRAAIFSSLTGGACQAAVAVSAWYRQLSGAVRDGLSILLTFAHAQHSHRG
jgi:hypothetical protein